MKKKTAPKTEAKKTTKVASNKATKGTKTAKVATTKKDKAASEPKTNTKTAIVLGLLRRDKGATIAELMKASDWQAHSVLSGTIGKKMGLKLESEKNDGGERTYRIPA